MGTITSQCQDAEGLGGPLGPGAPWGCQGRTYPTTPARSKADRERQGTAPALGIRHLPGDRAGPKGLEHWPIGGGQHQVRGTRVRCSPRMSKAIKVVQGTQRDGKILFLYQPFRKPHSYFLFSLCSFQFIILVCRYLLQGHSEEYCFPA